MLLVPKHELENKLKHIRLSVGTLGSTSIAPPGTGFTYIPVYGWAVASGAASLRYTNGTSGSTLFEMKLASGAYAEINFWEEANVPLTNKAPVLESDTGIGAHEFHVWVMKVRGGAGQNSGAGNETALTGL